MRRLLCKTFGHRRKVRGVRRSGTSWRSICVVCHEPLFRFSHGDWRPSGRQEPPVEEQLEFLILLDRSPGIPRVRDR